MRFAVVAVLLGSHIWGGLSLHSRQSLSLGWTGRLLTRIGKEFSTRLNRCQQGGDSLT